MFALQSLLMSALTIILFGIKIFALVDCIARSPQDFERAATITKNGWMVILGLSVAAHVVFWGPLDILNLVGTVAALVYLAQLRGSTY